MKNKLIILITTTIGLFLVLLANLIFANENQFRIILALEMIALIFLFIYIFAGVGKVVSSIIYVMCLALLLVFLPKYDTALFFIGTFIFALNPLHDLEAVVDERFNEEKSILSYIRGSYSPYYEYRKEIKNYYHLPQMRKVYNEPNYLKIRRAVTIILSMVAIFLLIREVNNLANIFKNFNIHTFFASTYSVIVLVILTVILYRKGFQSTLNFFTISIFPPVAYSIYLMVNPLFMAVLLGTIVMILGIAASIYQYYAFRNRIVFEYYYYYDNDLQAEVYANALFEPFVYNEAFHLTVKYFINIDKNSFEKVFHNIVVYADFHRFFITSYTNDHSQIVLYTEFHHGSEKKISKFTKYLKNLVQEEVSYQLIVDKDKTFYEENFFHKNDYIVARTIYLSQILKKLEISSNVIVSFTVYFSSLKDLNDMSNSYSVSRLLELDLENVLTARIDMQVVNNQHVIEAKVREFLLDLLINRGKYVRVSVYF